VARRIFHLLALLALTVGVGVGVFVAFFRTFWYCFRPGNSVFCRTTTLWEQQPIVKFPQTYLFLLLWSIAPVLAYVGVWFWFRRSKGLAVACLLLSLGIEVSSLSSEFGRYYVTLVTPVLLGVALGLPLILGKSVTPRS
jgi:hypothetical protein